MGMRVVIDFKTLDGVCYADGSSNPVSIIRDPIKQSGIAIAPLIARAMNPGFKPPVTALLKQVSQGADAKACDSDESSDDDDDDDRKSIKKSKKLLAVTPAPPAKIQPPIQTKGPAKTTSPTPQPKPKPGKKLKAAVQMQKLATSPQSIDDDAIAYLTDDKRGLAVPPSLQTVLGSMGIKVNNGSLVHPLTAYQVELAADLYLKFQDQEPIATPALSATPALPPAQKPTAPVSMLHVFIDWSNVIVSHLKGSQSCPIYS